MNIKLEQDRLREIKPDEFQKHEFEKGPYEINTIINFNYTYK